MRDIRAFTSVGIPGLLAACITAGQAQAQASEVSIPAGALVCLFENREKYLELPRNVIIFFPALCPAVSREEVAAIVQNSAVAGGRQATRAIMLKSEFSCLVERIGAQLASGADLLTDPDAEMTFVLDCD